VTEPAWLEIDLTRLDANTAAFRSAVGGSVKLCAVVKADAYGLGAARIARRLAALGVDMLAVYSLEQARRLVGAGIDRAILVLMPVRELDRAGELYRAAVSGRLHLTIHDTPQLDQLNRIGQQWGCRLPVHLYLDTGMSRSGLTAAEFSAAMGRVEGLRYLQLAGIYTHLATAETDVDFADEQVDCLDRAIEPYLDRLPEGLLIHAANTFATLRDRRYHRSMVRVGLGLLGYGDTLLTSPLLGGIDERALQPVVRLLSRINHIQRYPKGTTVGYGCTHCLERDSVLSIVPVGCGDGYPLALGNQAVVRVYNPGGDATFTAPVVGRVSMDQVVIDLTAAEEGDPSHASHPASPVTAQVGSLVELISNDPASPCALPKLAGLAGTSCYEMLCRLSPCLTRRYITAVATTTDVPVVASDHQTVVVAHPPRPSPAAGLV
jgi:alanine racemase